MPNAETYDFSAEAELWMATSGDIGIGCPCEHLRNNKLGVLINAVMSKRKIERPRFSIMVGEKVLWLADIEALSKHADFPKDTPA